MSNEETHCKRCGRLTNISDARIVQQLGTKVLAQKIMLAALHRVVLTKTGHTQALNRTIKQLLDLMPEEQKEKAKALVAQQRRKVNGQTS